MTLPKISMPQFSVEQPSTKKLLDFRPFRVKEEKLMLIAKESGEKNEILKAIRQMIINCITTPDFEPEKMTVFDMEYLFIKIRAKSVDNIVKFEVEDSDDKIKYDIEVDLNDVEVQYFDDHNSKIMLDDKVGLVLKYPTADIAEKVSNMNSLTAINFKTIDECIDYVFDEENVYPWFEATEEEKDNFLELLSVDSYNDIQNFFDTVPRIEHVVEYENSNKVKKIVVFRNLHDFFDLG